MAVTGATSNVDLAFAGVTGQVRHLRQGDVSARELTELCLERIQRLDPQLNAFRIVLGEQALAAADQADARRRAGEDRPLLGVPIAIKDDQDVAGQVTARGTLGNSTPCAADSEVVRRLRGAGAVIVGKTNVPELMAMPWTETTAYGATRNPWDIDRTPGGSSGGSAAAVAAGLVALATASDGAGSIRIPAGGCGLVGLKPQRDRVPLAPLRSAWHGLSVFGAVTRTVADSALFYDTVKDGGPSFAAATEREPGRLRIAVSTRVPPPIQARVDAEYLGAVERTAQRLRDLGHEVAERELDYGRVIAGVVVRYMSGIHEDANALEHPERLGRVGRDLSRAGALLPSGLVERMMRAEAVDAEQLNRPFHEGFDLVLTPMFTRRPPRVLEYEGRGGMWSFTGAARFTPFTASWNHTGQPAIALPAGSADDGFPLAVQFLAPPDGEPALLSLAAQLERNLNWPAHRPAVAT